MLILPSNTVVDSIAGSTLYGTNGPSSDQDTMGFFVATQQQKLGLTCPDHCGKDDQVIYEFSRLVQLIMNGNPTVMQLLYTPEMFWLQWDQRWPSIQADMRGLLVSERCRASFLGYLDGQRKKLINKRGQRQELIDQYGYDTKFAAHMVRLAVQGLEMMKDGWMTLPMKEKQLIVDIRQGKFTQETVMEMTATLEDELMHIPSVLPAKLDNEKISQYMADVYKEWWGLCPISQ